MKKLSLFVLFALLVVPSMAFAGGVINNSNLSPEYIGSFARNAATDAPDIAHYNPAGTVWMADGLHIALGNQFVIKEYSHTTADGTMFKDNEPVFLLPNIFAVYKMDNFAIFGSFTVPAGGGSIKYNDGVFYNSPIITVDKAEGFTAHFQTAIGGAYKFSEMFSVAIIGRFIYGLGDVRSNATAFGSPILAKQYDTTAKGFGGTISLNARPIKDLLLTLRVESPVKLNWDVTNDASAFLQVDGRREDLPPIIGFGASYKISPMIRVEGNFNYYINKMATWEKQDDGIHGDDTEFQKKFDNGWEVAAMGEVTINPTLKLRFGGMYTIAGSNKHTHDYLRPPLDAFSFGVGATYTMKNLDIVLGVSKSWYFEDDIVSDDGNITLKGNKETIAIALGVNYRF